MNENTQVIEMQPQNRNMDVIQPLPIDAIIQRHKSIQELLEKVMKIDIHYGLIPGCGKKPTLLKPGAETIKSLFQLADEYTVQSNELEGGHREYVINCRLTSICTGLLVSSGIGMATTMESKHRFRDNFELTDRAVPKQYWKDRDISLIGGKGFFVKKNEEGQWMVAKVSDEKSENTNPADQHNTVLKMGKKRALVDAVLSLGASEFFTQDIEDMKDNLDKARTQREKEEHNQSQQTQEKEEGISVQEVAQKLEQEFETQLGYTYGAIGDIVEAIQQAYKEDNKRLTQAAMEKMIANPKGATEYVIAKCGIRKSKPKEKESDIFDRIKYIMKNIQDEMNNPNVTFDEICKTIGKEAIEEALNDKMSDDSIVKAIATEFKRKLDQPSDELSFE